MRFTITRSKWVRGLGSHRSKLLRPDGMMCCMGQVAKQCGCDDATLLGRGSYFTLDIGPTTLLAKAGVLIESRRGVDPHEPEWVCSAYSANDNAGITDAEREQKLSALAAANGHEMVFVD